MQMCYSPCMPPVSEAGALVLFSGGQDSTVCLAWALSRYSQVETIGFDYGQRHHVEMDCRLQVLLRYWCILALYTLRWFLIKHRNPIERIMQLPNQWA